MNLKPNTHSFLVQIWLLCLLGLWLSPSEAISQQPTPLRNDITVTQLNNSPANPVRMVKHPVTGEIYILNESGGIYLLNTATGSYVPKISPNRHGLSQTYGLEIGMSGNFYVVAAEQSGGFNTGKIAKGVPDGTGGYTWSILAETEPYRSSGNRDHQFNAIIESLDGKYVYVNSGSRTDHAEEANNDGLREMPITSCILKIPTDTVDLILQNDESFLESNGFIYADGIRNTFDMAYAPDGHLFGVENCDTRDNEEELNWLREGKHYGFPWRIGTQMNPQQYPNFNPPGSDNLLVQGINMESTFYNDPTFPSIPAGLTFVDPVLNMGPDADVFRDSVDGVIKDASDLGRSIGTFTPHSSPVALVFDTDNQLGAPYTGLGFAMSYNGSFRRKYTPFGDPGEDLLMLELTLDPADSTYSAQITRIVEGFEGPIDNVLVGNDMYVIDYDGGNMWKLTFPSNGAQGLPSTTSALGPMIKVFPNPATDQISLEARMDNVLINSALILNGQGQELGYLINSGNEIYTGDIEQLPVGVYYIQVKTNRGTVLKKFVK